MRSVLRWAAGIVLLWGMFAMLWMPWADYQKSYRSRGAAAALEDPGRRRLHRAAARSACRRPRRSTTMPASARSPFDIVQARTPARCCSCRATRSTSSTAPARAGSSSPTSAGPATVRALPPLPPAEDEHHARRIECPSWAKLAQHAESWRSVHLRELFADRRRAQRAVRRRSAGRALRLLAPAPGRDDAAPARPPRRRARLCRVARGAARRQARSTPPRSAPPGIPRCAPAMSRPPRSRTRLRA